MFIHTYVHTYIDMAIHTYIHMFIHTYIHMFMHTYIHGTCVPLGSLPRKHRRVAARSSPHYRRVGGEKIAPGYQPGWCGPAVPLERGPERGSILQSTDEWLQELRPLRRPAANGVPCRVLGLVSQGSHTSRFSCLRWRVRSTALLRYGSVSLRSLIAFSRLPSGVSKVVPNKHIHTDTYIYIHIRTYTYGAVAILAQYHSGSTLFTLL